MKAGNVLYFIVYTPLTPKPNIKLVKWNRPIYEPTFELRSGSKTYSVLVNTALASADQHKQLCGAYSSKLKTLGAEAMLCLAVTNHSTGDV